MKEFVPSAPYLGEESPLITPAVVTTSNDTWLSNALHGNAIGERELNNATAHLVTLPPNISFVSVLGQRSLEPGAGGECRIVFDPPLDSVSGWTPKNQKGKPSYIQVPTGNPNAVQVWEATTWDQRVDEKPSMSRTHPGDPGYSPLVNYTHLVDWQLDPSIRYKLAVIDGSTPSVNEAPPNGTCNFNLLQIWKA